MLNHVYILSIYTYNTPTTQYIVPLLLQFHNQAYLPSAIFDNQHDPLYNFITARYFIKSNDEILKIDEYDLGHVPS